MTDTPELIAMARAIAEAFGDELDHAFLNKSEWNAARGEKGGRFRDINEPMRSHYFDAARATLVALRDLSPQALVVGEAIDGTISAGPMWTAIINHIAGEQGC